MATTLTLLGTGNPGNFPNIYQIASTVVIDGTPFVIDCGAGVVQRLSRAKANGQDALVLDKLNTLILTHLHPDHSAGLIDFMVSTWIKGRKEPLRIYGPAGTEKMTDLLMQAYELGIAEHRDTESPTSWPLLYEVIEYTEGELIVTEFVTISAFEVSHGGLETYGLKFVTKDGTVVFSSDTRPHPSVIEHSKSCDILVHEVYSEIGSQDPRPNNPQSYFRRMHISTVELAEIANEAKPKKLVLHHQMHLGAVSDEEMVKEITDLYDGEVVFGRDLDVFEL